MQAIYFFFLVGLRACAECYLSCLSMAGTARVKTEWCACCVSSEVRNHELRSLPLKCQGLHQAVEIGAVTDMILQAGLSLWANVGDTLLCANRQIGVAGSSGASYATAAAWLKSPLYQHVGHANVG